MSEQEAIDRLRQQTATQREPNSRKGTKKTYQTVRTTRLRAYMSRYNLSKSQMGKVLGMSGSGVAGWLEKDYMPQHVDLAIECLERRDSRYTLKTVTYIVTLPSEQKDLFDTFCIALPGVSVTELKLALQK